MLQQTKTNQHTKWLAIVTGLLLAALALLMAKPQPAKAATITVNAMCSLADAVTAANTDMATGGCLAGKGADSIILDGGTYNLTTAYDIPGFGSKAGLPVITSSITIEGNGAALIRDTSAPEFRILHITDGGDLTLNDVTISGGDPGFTQMGGGIYVEVGGTLVLNRSTVSDNTNHIRNLGTSSINHSTISGNLGNRDAITNFGLLTIDSSTVNNNNGTGVINNNSEMTILNSTISQNSEYGVADVGFDGQSFTTIQNSTVTGNQGGIVSFGFSIGGTTAESQLTLKQTIVSGNSGTADTYEIYSEGNSTIIADSYNLIGSNGSANSSGFTPSGTDMVPNAALDAILDTTLQHNGGDTKTHALVEGSPALDAAPTGLADDQRGVSRPQRSAFDIGAFELEPVPTDTTPPVITLTVSGTLGNNDWYRSDVTVSWSITDTESSFTIDSGCVDTTLSSDTAGITLTCEATSEGGTASDSVNIKRDATAPVVSVTGVADGATYILGSVPTAGCDTSDALSGVAVAASPTLSGGNPDGSGIITATCDGALDNAGNSGVASVSYTVLTPQEAIGELQDDIQTLVDAGILNNGQANGLTQPLDNAIRSLNRGKTVPACSQIGDFMAGVEAMTPDPLNAATAADLIADAAAIQEAIGCQ